MEGRGKRKLQRFPIVFLMYRNTVARMGRGGGGGGVVVELKLNIQAFSPCEKSTPVILSVKRQRQLSSSPFCCVSVTMRRLLGIKLESLGFVHAAFPQPGHRLKFRAKVSERKRERDRDRERERVRERERERESKWPKVAENKVVT